MAGSSQSTSRSTSDTYIPEYSQTPILEEIARHARSMADTVYQWGMDRYNKAQGDIDSLMRDALSYASPQRIAVDMGMAEAGVQQAAERGRQSAIRDLEGYGIDPSSGRYAQLANASMIMSAAAAAGAGNQQRMADQAAGNAMRNQAIAAGQQNAQFGLGVGEGANKFLQTASSLKYPPLGRRSESESQSSSQTTDAGKSGGSEKPPAEPRQPQERPPAAGGGAKKSEEAPPAQFRNAPPQKQPTETPETPTGKTGEDSNEPKPETETEAPLPGEGAYPPWEGPLQEPLIEGPEEPDRGYPPFEGPVQYPPFEGPMPPEPTPEPTPTAEPTTDPAAVASYDPYQDQPATGDVFGVDPVTGLPTGTAEDQETAVAEADPAGGVYGIDPGGWIEPTGYAPDETTAPDPWSDTGTEQTGVYDSAYDTYTEEGPGGFEEPTYEEPTYEEPAYEEPTYEQPDFEYEDPYAGWNEEDYYDQFGDQEDWGDFGDQEDFDFGEEDTGEEDWGDFGDEEDFDYGDEDLGYEEPDYAEEPEYADAGDDFEYDYGDYGDGGDGGEYARGGPVRRRQGMRPSRPRPRTGYRSMPSAGMRLDPPPKPPGAALRAVQPPQAPRPARGVPMAAPGGPRPAPIGRGPRMPGNFISANGMIPPSVGGMPVSMPQRMAGGGSAGRRAEPTQGGFVSRELSPSNGSQVDDVNARLNAGEFVIPKDVSAWKGKEFFYKLIAQARKNRAGGDKPQQSQMGYSGATPRRGM